MLFNSIECLVNVFKYIESLLFITVLLKRIIYCCYGECTDRLQVIMCYLAQYKYACYAPCPVYIRTQLDMCIIIIIIIIIILIYLLLLLLVF